MTELTTIIIPQEISDEIIYKIGDPETLADLSLVCRAWRHTAQALKFRVVRLKNVDSADDFLRLIRSEHSHITQHICKIIFTELVTWDQVCKILSIGGLTSLSSLDFLGIHPCIPRYIARAIQTRLSTVTELSVVVGQVAAFDNLRNFLHAMPNLERLIVVAYAWLGPHWKDHIDLFPALPRLQYFRLETHRPARSFIPPFVTPPLNLRVSELRFVASLSDQDVAQLEDFFCIFSPSLEELMITFHSPPSRAILQAINIQSCRKLRKVTITQSNLNYSASSELHTHFISLIPTDALEFLRFDWQYSSLRFTLPQTWEILNNFEWSLLEQTLRAAPVLKGIQLCVDGLNDPERDEELRTLLLEYISNEMPAFSSRKMVHILGRGENVVG